jgi:hypothetical protein
MRVIVLFLSLLLVTSLTSAFETIPLKASQIRSSFDQSFKLKSGDSIRLHGLYTFNNHGEKELLVYLIESHILTFESEQLVLIGRDLDDDGLVDTWFYQNDQGNVLSLAKALKGEKDFESLKQVLDEVFDESGRWMVSIIMKYAFQNLTLTGDVEYEFWSQYEGRQIDLIDMQIRVDRLLKLYPTDASIITFKKTNGEAWANLYNDFNKHNGVERFKMVGADLALFFAGGVLARGIGFLGKVAINKIGIEELVASVNKMGEKHYLQLKARMTNSKAKIVSKFTTRFAENGGAFGPILTRIWAVSIYERPAIIIQDLVMKSHLARVVSKNFGYFIEGLKEIYSTKGYILYSASIQLGTEAVSRSYFSFSDVPIILDEPLKKTEDIVRKIGSDKELVQNLTYMTTETSVISGVAKVMELKGVSLSKRFIVCGFISTMNSMIMGKLVKDEVNVARMASDTAWEVVVGNSQVLFDLWQWQKWKDFGKSIGNNQLKLAGVLVTFVHQAAGYYYYSKWAELAEGKSEPIVASGQNQSTGANYMAPEPGSENKTWQPVLVPVYTP